ncbi:MAG: hypothetical protein B7X06_04020 [Verrucomicrobia bacterium 21-51-4]|nr:MAG: hypothetical protein B7X06_04020 [Verrucomicrobia bacterium 21-51-4]HQU09765.1 stilbene synthase [Opitutales bacterium]
MYLNALETYVPASSYTQEDCWALLNKHGGLNSLNARSQSILERILLGGASGIGKRHFVVPDWHTLFNASADTLQNVFECYGPQMATRAAERALQQSGWEADTIDALFICTCTGYLCPGLSSYVAEQLDLAKQTFLQDFVGLGCGAAIPTLRAAHNLLSRQPDAKVVCIAVEVCSAAFYLDNDPGVLISLCLFGDGAAASLWSNTPSAGSHQASNFSTLHWPKHRDDLRFRHSGGKLKNCLAKTVPATAARAVSNLLGQYSTDWNQTKLICHPGGRDVLLAIESAVPEAGQLKNSASVLHQFGNLSSPSVLFALKEALMNVTTQKSFLLTSFGAGFSAHAMEFSWH